MDGVERKVIELVPRERGGIEPARLAAYLEQLPEGLDSYPHCRAKASIHRTVYDFAGAPSLMLPPALQSLLDEPPPVSAWIPQCHSLALVVAIVEAQDLPLHDEVLWIREASSRLFGTPMYRLLMRAATRRMVVKSAKHRWAAFFRGSALSSEVERSSAALRLAAPRGMFNLDLAEIFTQVIHAAINFARDADDATAVVLRGTDGESIDFGVCW